MDNKEDIEGFVMDDSSITRMRKFYNHKKDRTLAAPKDTSVTTNTVLDNNVRILLLNVYNFIYLIYSSLLIMVYLIVWVVVFKMVKKVLLFQLFKLLMIHMRIGFVLKSINNILWNLRIKEII